jgi:hypothetical protein
MSARMFGRLGKRADVERAAREVVANGGNVSDDRDAQTTIATNPSDGAVIFRALHKGGGVWLVMYSRDYYADGGGQ